MKRFKEFHSALIVLMCCGMGAVVSARNAPTPEVAAVASRIGLEPEAIVVAGLHASASQILERIDDEDVLMAQLAARESAAAQLSSELAQVSRNMQGRMDDVPLRNQFETLVAQRDAAVLQVQETLEALREHALDGVSVASRSILDRWKDTQSRRVPAEYRVKSYETAQWEAIELALRAETRAIQRQVPLAAEEAALLAQVRSDPEVIEATQRLAEHLAAVVLAMTPEPES